MEIPICNLILLYLIHFIVSYMEIPVCKQCIPSWSDAAELRLRVLRNLNWVCTSQKEITSQNDKYLVSLSNRLSISLFVFKNIKLTKHTVLKTKLLSISQFD